jgi:hypothetical protein
LFIENLSEAGFNMYALSPAHFVFISGLSRVAPREILALSSLDKIKVLSGDEGVFYLLKCSKNTEDES